MRSLNEGKKTLKNAACRKFITFITRKKPTSETLLRQSNHYAGSFHDLLFGIMNLPCEFSLPFINTHQVCVVVLADLHYYLPQPIFSYLKTVFSDQFEINDRGKEKLHT